jgi:hypothetical protein
MKAWAFLLMAMVAVMLAWTPSASAGYGDGVGVSSLRGRQVQRFRSVQRFRAPIRAPFVQRYRSPIRYVAPIRVQPIVVDGGYSDVQQFAATDCYDGGIQTLVQPNYSPFVQRVVQPVYGGYGLADGVARIVGRAIFGQRFHRGGVFRPPFRGRVGIPIRRR